MAQLTFINAKVQILSVLQNFADITFEFPDAGGSNNANAITILNSGGDGGFPGNARLIAFDDNTDTWSATCISIIKIQSGVSLVWRVHIQTVAPTAQSLWDSVKELNHFFASQVLDNLYIDNDL